MNKKIPLERYQNKEFLIALGRRCRELRLKKGLSIDRMTKAGERLSPGAIQRLETGSADVQVSLLFRYTQVLEISLKDLFNFDYSEAENNIEILPFVEDEPSPKGAVPFYSIAVAAGVFKNDNYDVEPQGWVVVDRRGSLKDLFALRINGKSMEPTIADGSICLFRKYTGGSRNGLIMLVQAKGFVDPESKGNFVVKRYKRMANLNAVHLLSDNPKFPPIVLNRTQEDMIFTPAIFVEVL